MTELSTMSCDYLVIGGGSAGAVLAARLSEDPKNHVILVEAGSVPKGFWVSTPLGVARLIQDTKLLWRFFTTPQTAMKNQQIFWPRGKALGGSSAVNGMLWTRGDRTAYDAIEAMGCPGYGWNAFSPYLNRCETFEGPNSQARGATGPVHASMINADDALTRAFFGACNANGFPTNEDFNDGDQTGVSHLQFSIKDAKRHSTHEAYLKPIAGRANLTILTETTCERLTLVGKRVTGAVLRTAESKVHVQTDGEVLVCAGALKSPQIFEMSGVGRPEILKGLGIDVVHAVAEMGENLIDHVNTRMTYRARQPITLNDVMGSKLKTLIEGMKYVFLKKGFLTYPTVTSHAIRELAAGDRHSTAKIQLGMISGPDRYSNTSDAGLDDYSGFNIGTFQLYPKSRGAVHSVSIDPQADPEMSADYFADEYDRALAVEQLKLVRDVAAASPLAHEILEETRPGLEAADDAALLDYALETGQTCWHPVGTARMGTDKSAVVDPDCRVNGLQGVRIVDASVWPDMPASNTNAPTIALAERIAERIKETGSK